MREISHEKDDRLPRLAEVTVTGARPGSVVERAAIRFARLLCALSPLTAQSWRAKVIDSGGAGLWRRRAIARRVVRRRGRDAEVARGRS